MWPRLIGVIYFYVVSAGSLILIVVGIFNSVNFVVNSTQFDKYPLRYGVQNCDYLSNKYLRDPMGPYPANIAPEASISAEEMAEQQKVCEEQQELDRVQHRVDYLRDSITFLTVGIILFLIHFPRAIKMSKEKI